MSATPSELSVHFRNNLNTEAAVYKQTNFDISRSRTFGTIRSTVNFQVVIATWIRKLTCPELISSVCCGSLDIYIQISKFLEFKHSTGLNEEYRSKRITKQLPEASLFNGGYWVSRTGSRSLVSFMCGRI